MQKPEGKIYSPSKRAYLRLLNFRAVLGSLLVHGGLVLAMGQMGESDKKMEKDRFECIELELIEAEISPVESGVKHESENKMPNKKTGRAENEVSTDYQLKKPAKGKRNQGSTLESANVNDDSPKNPRKIEMTGTPVNLLHPRSSGPKAEAPGTTRSIFLNKKLFAEVGDESFRKDEERKSMPKEGPMPPPAPVELSPTERENLLRALAGDPEPHLNEATKNDEAALKSAPQNLPENPRGASRKARANRIMAKNLRESFKGRMRVRTKQEAHNREVAVSEWELRLLKIWKSNKFSLDRKKQIFFQLWDECWELSDDEVGAWEGHIARQKTITFIKKYFREGTDWAYTIKELKELNAKRESKARFEPYK